MTIDPKDVHVDIGQSDEERHKLIAELELLEDDAPPPVDGEALSGEDVFVDMQAQTLGSGALAIDRIDRER